jgi:hypothetical protein
MRAVVSVGARTILSSPSYTPVLPLAPVLGLLLALALLPQVHAQTPADTTAAPAEVATEVVTEAADAVVRRRVRPIVSPAALYSGSRGFGVGGGVAVSNLARPGDHLQVEGRVSQRLQSAFGAYMTGEPEIAPLFGLIGGAVMTTSRYPFFGTGPHADPDGRLDLERSEWEVEGRIGWSPFGTDAVLLQPTVRYRADRLRDYAPADSGALAFVSAEDLAALDALRDDARSGVSVGLSAITDTRNNKARPARGAYLQGSAARFFSTDGSGLKFNRFETTGYLFRPAPFRLPFQPERGAVFVRVAGVVVREDGVDSGLPILYYPVFDRDLLMGWPVRSFVGQDALSVGVGSRGVVVNRIGAFRVEGTALALLGAAYNDVFREFSPRVSLSSDPVGVGENVPLRPSFGVGINLHYRDRERPLVGGLIGIGPGGITTTSFRLVVGLDRYRPEIR